MAKKLVVAAALLVAALCWRALESRPVGPVVEPGAGGAMALEEEPSRAVAALPEASATPTREVAPVAAGEPAPWQGRVVDGKTSQPIRGARIEVFPRRQMSLQQLKREQHEFLTQDWSGRVRSRHEWIDLPEEQGFEALAYDAPISVGVLLSTGRAALGEASSDAAGEFELDLTEGGMLRVRHEGYGQRVLAVDGAEGDLVVELWPLERLRGQVIDAEGEPVERAFALRFLDQGPTRITGYTDVTTEPDGSFDVLLPGERVAAESRTPGWVVTGEALHPLRKQRWYFSTQFQPGGEPDPVYIAVDRAEATRLCVVDDESELPVEDFWLLVRDEARDAVRECGRFHAPGGLQPLTEEGIRGPHREYETETHGTATVWTAEHAAATVAFDNLLAGEQLEVRLSRGQGVTRLAGRVVRGARPLAGALVGLRPWRRYSHQRLEDARLLDRVRTDEDGAFELHGPPGELALQIEHEGEHRTLDVVLPADAPVLVDFEATCTFELTLRDLTGAPCVDFPVIINQKSGQIGGSTDEQGFVRFQPLEPGTVEVYLRHEAVHGSGPVHEVREIELHLRETLREQWTLPIPIASVHPRLVVDGWEGAFEGWRARDGSLGEWVDVALEGTVPIDVKHGRL